MIDASFSFAPPPLNVRGQEIRNPNPVPVEMPEDEPHSGATSRGNPITFQEVSSGYNIGKKFRRILRGRRSSQPPEPSVGPGDAYHHERAQGSMPIDNYNQPAEHFPYVGQTDYGTGYWPGFGSQDQGLSVDAGPQHGHLTESSLTNQSSHQSMNSQMQSSSPQSPESQQVEGYDDSTNHGQWSQAPPQNIGLAHAGTWQQDPSATQWLDHRSGAQYHTAPECHSLPHHMSSAHDQQCEMVTEG